MAPSSSKIPRNSGGRAGTPEEGEWAQIPGSQVMYIDVLRTDRTGHERSAAEAEAFARVSMLLVRGEARPKLTIESQPDRYRISRTDGNLIKIPKA